MENKNEEIVLVKDDEKTQIYLKNKLDLIYQSMINKECSDAIEYINWLKTKTDMRYNPEIEKSYPLFSSGVYYVNLGKNIGSEQDKDRPCILLSGSKLSETVIIIPISDEKEGQDGFWYHVQLSSGDTALVEQIRAISKTRIRRAIWKNGKVRSISLEECKEINNAIDKLKIFIKK